MTDILSNQGPRNTWTNGQNASTMKTIGNRSNSGTGMRRKPKGGLFLDEGDVTAMVPTPGPWWGT
jgi:hypothetical protein